MVKTFAVSELGGGTNRQDYSDECNIPGTGEIYKSIIIKIMELDGCWTM